MTNVYSLCILDDKIPVQCLTDIEVDETGYIDSNILRHCLKLDDWDDPDLKSFVEALQEEKSFLLSGFRNHNFFFNYKQNCLFSPDVIVFDWDVGDTTDSAENLLRLLKETHSFVSIFSGADNGDIIARKLEEGEFKEYENRLSIVSKNSPNSVFELKEKIKEKSQSFYFAFSRDFKIKTEQALSEALSDFDKLSYEQFVSCFGETKEGKSALSKLDFVEIIAERFKNALISSDFKGKLEVPYREIKDESCVKKIWHFRLYQKPQDNIVRKGDIIKKENSDSLYFVLSSDCHLRDFWKKNLGYLTLVPIYRLETIKERLKNYLNENAIRGFKITSIVNPQCIGNITILPGVFLQKAEDGSVCYEDGILFPKEILGVEIPRLEDVNNESAHLMYTHIPDIIGQNRIHLAEPFLSPLIQFILKNITDVGVPDFGCELQTVLKNKIRGICKNEI